MGCAVGSVKHGGQITACGRGRRIGRKRIGRANPFRMQVYGQQRQEADTGHRMNRRPTLGACARLAGGSSVLETGIRSPAGRQRASSLPLPHSAGYIGDALSDRVVRLKHFTCEEIASCIHIAFVSHRAR